MRKLFLAFIVFALVLFIGCGFIPIPKRGLMEGEKPVTMFIESVIFYERLETKVGGAQSFRIDTSSSARSDEYAQAIVKKVAEVLTEALAERGVAISPSASIKVQVAIAEEYKSAILTRLITGRVQSVGGIRDAYSVHFTSDIARPLFSRDSWRNIANGKFAAGKMTEILANNIIIALRQMGVITK